MGGKDSDLLPVGVKKHFAVAHLVFELEIELEGLSSGVLHLYRTTLRCGRALEQCFENGVDFILEGGDEAGLVALSSIQSPYNFAARGAFCQHGTNVVAPSLRDFL